MTMSSSRFFERRHNSGVALIIVLAFVVLLSGLVVAYLLRSGTDRQLAQSSFDDTNADLLARSALDIVVGDFKQEIADGSNLSFARYAPRTNDDVIPKRSGNPSFAGAAINDPAPNLIRRSVYPDSIPAPGVPSRASMVNSTTGVSANGRSITLERWNNHYLLPRHDPSSATGSTPKSPLAAPYGPGDSNGFVPPDWVIVTRDGPTEFATWDATLANANATNHRYALGRYAYAVYDEGGLLDINVAGYPTSVSPSTTDIGRKGVLAFADLTALPTTPGNSMTATAINKFILFRNYATTQSASTLGATTSFSASGTQNFVNYFLGNPQIGASADFISVRKTAPWGGRTDQSFVSRAELIGFRNSLGIANPNTLQYLGTFSRERNKPSWRAGATTAALENALDRRFYIGNLDLVRPGATGLQNTVGLAWVAGNPGYWRYTGASGTAALDHIPALSASQRDFFALLNYALNRVDGDDYGNIRNTLAAGVSLIDQYDADAVVDPASGSTTTTIQFGGGSAYGFEDSDPARPTGAPTPPPSSPPVVLNRPFRNVGEFGYGVKTTASGLPTLDFYRTNSSDAPVLDLFTYNSATVRSGIVNLNTRQPTILAAILKGSLSAEGATSSNITLSPAMNAANTIVNATATPGGAALSRADIARLANLVTSSPFGSGSEEVRETIARALAEVTQTRTWNLLIDMVAQTGRYPPNATSLSDFVVQGEKRYWLHVAIDRFDGTIIDQQFEAVYE
jgi:hypothetical protein